jgi:ligand-binding sensor domain-containing protein/serine phosphatase RsbU (regulator of sigma subunit)
MRYFLLLASVLYCSLVSAQNQSLKFAHILPENGLSHSFVTVIVQDHNGFMWFGTKDGLNRFDGYNFTVYKNNPDNKQSLSHNFVIDIFVDRENNLWIASWGGLSKFDTRTEVFTQYRQNKNDPNSLPNDLLSSVYEDHSGNLWLGSAEGLILFDRKKNRFISYRYDKNDPSSIGDDYVRDIHMDHKNRLWVGTYKGGLNLFDYRTGKFTRFQHDEKNPSSIGHNCAYTIFQDSKKRMWIGSHEDGFDRFDPETGKFIHFKKDPLKSNSLVHNAVTCFNEDVKGNIWIGTENGGISIFNAETGKFLNHQHDEVDDATLGSNSLYSICKDRDGNMWLGTYSDGVNFLSLEASKFEHFRHTSSSESLSNNNVLCFFEDSEKNLWIGTDGGGANLYDRNAGTMTTFRNIPGNKNSIAGNYVLSVAEDSAKQIWFGTWGTGISIYNPKTRTFRHLKNDPADPGSLNCDNAWCIYKCSQNKMWVGTYRGTGLDQYDYKKNAFVHFSTIPGDSASLNNHYINFIYEDRAGRFWIGTSGGGLNLMDRKTNKFKAIKRGSTVYNISSNNVECIFEDNHGNLWLGTDLGLNCLDMSTGRVKIYTIKDGLPSDVVYGIQEDKKGLLWISTTKGLSRYNAQEKKFTNYTIADGLQSAEFKPRSSRRCSTGAMYFGGINGFNEFNPDSLTDNEIEYPLYITSFKILNRPVPVSGEFDGKVVLNQTISVAKEITLNHRQAFFSFEFASLNYSVPEKNQYAYKLEGFDEDWNYIGSRRFASYTDVPPGTYTFRIKASHNNGKWKENEGLVITVTPPFWNTWWFKLISVLTVLGIAFTVVAVRIRTIKAQKEDLEKQVAARTLDLQEAASKIEQQRDSLQSANQHVMSSINYANSIQKAILSPADKIEETVSDYFIIYKAKEVVSGDFYWFSTLEAEDLARHGIVAESVSGNMKFVAAVDCTGHGVSGAFMSIIGNTLFNEIVNQKHITDPGEILEALDAGFNKAIKCSDGLSVAGMDVCLCRLEQLNADFVKVSFSGARRPLFYVENGSREVHKLTGDIMSIGSDFKDGNFYKTTTVVIPSGSMLYLTSDGFLDQQNEKNKKFGSSRLVKVIESVCDLPMAEQKKAFEIALAEHQQHVAQRDDITLIGVRV